jgi:nucleoside-diphosphate-sugar epimerase
MILVTGGTGLLGSHLLFDIVRSGKEVRAIHRRGSDLARVRRVFSYYSEDPETLFRKISWVEGDLLDLGSLEDALTGISEVYHAGAVVSFRAADRAWMHQVNVEGTANLVNLSLDAGIRKFCHVSSIATLGRAENDGICTEETWWVPSDRNSAYSLSKYGAEREVWRGIEEGLKAVIVNPSVILGPGFWNSNSSLFRMVYNGLPFYTRGINGFVDVRDVVAAMTGLMASGQVGERFICSAANLPYRDLFTMIASAFGKRPPHIFVPPWLAEVAWRAEAARAFVTRRSPDITRELSVTASQFYRYTSDKLLNTIDFSFRDINKTVRDICGLFVLDHS